MANDREILGKKISEASGVEEIMELMKAAGREITREEAEQLFTDVQDTEDRQKLSLEDLDTVSGGGPGCDVEAIRDKDTYNLSIEERKYMYYRLDVLRHTKTMEECQDIMKREFYRFGIYPLTEAFVAKWYSSKVKVTDIELQLRLDDIFGD